MGLTENQAFYTPTDMEDDFQRTFLPGLTENFERLDDIVRDLLERIDQGGQSIPGLYNIRDYGAQGAYKLDSKGKPLVGNAENTAMDDRAAIQAALNAARDAGGGIVLVPPGAYPIKDTLSIYSNTTLYMLPGAYIVRNGQLGAFFINGDKGASYGGFSGHGNILVKGGTLEGNEKNIERRFNFFSLGHGQNIRIENVKMLDLLTYHAIEINSSKTVKIINCIFDGFRVDSNYSDQSRRSEAIQLDMALDESVFGPFGAYDKTTCEDILITGCTFRNWDRAIGTHTGASGYAHKDIRIVNNHFQQLSGEAIISCLWENVVISGNTFHNVGTGIHLRVKDTTTDIVRGYSITGNTFWDMKNGSSIRHALLIQGGNTQIKNVEFTGNTIRGAVQTSIYAENCSILNIADNSIVQGETGGIYLTNVVGANITDNAVNDTSSSAISCEGCTDLVIDGNRLKNAGNHGIFLSGCTDNAVNGNHVRGVNVTGGTGHGIYLAASTQGTAVNGNVVRGLGTGSKAFYVTNTCSGNLATGNHFAGGTITDNANTTMANNL